MEDFKRQGMRIGRNTIEGIREEYISLVNYYRRVFNTYVIDAINGQIRGISESKVEDWIEDYFISEIKSEGLRQINRLESELENNFNSMSRSINSNASRNIELYQESLNKIAKRDNSDWIYSIVNEFIKEICKKIEYYYDAFYGISNQNFYRNLDNIKSELKQKLNRATSQFLEEYRQILKQEFRKHNEKIEEQYEEYKNNNQTISEEYINKASTMLGYNGYELIRTGNKLYARNKKTQKVVELVYEKNSQTLVAKDNQMAIQVKEQYMFILDKMTDTAMIERGITFEISDIDRKNITKIVQGKTYIRFYQNDKEITELQELSTIIKNIESKYPGYYQQLCQNINFLKLTEKIILEDAKGTPEYEEAMKVLAELDSLEQQFLPSTTSLEDANYQGKPRK